MCRLVLQQGVTDKAVAARGAVSPVCTKTVDTRDAVLIFIQHFLSDDDYTEYDIGRVRRLRRNPVDLIINLRPLADNCRHKRSTQASLRHRCIS